MAVHSPPTLLLTRPRAASERFAEGLTGFDVVIDPLMEIVGTGAKPSLDDVAGVILTSENALPFLPNAQLPAYCVGPRTAKAARAAGFRAEVMGPDADGLVTELLSRKPKGPLLHTHGKHTRGDVAERLRGGGLDVRQVVVYEQRDLAPGDAFDRAMAQQNVIVPLFSPRSATRFVDALGKIPENLTLLAMSHAVRRAIPSRLQANTHVIAKPTGAEMRKAVEAFDVRPNSP